ncbi:MAG: DivIVA domain-containing protein [Streptosporangiales bacterium]|nr:DivIVA domain-containing protein [Streptosporangiales bacterium]
MTEKSAFLSYARVDGERAGRLERILESAGIRVEREEPARAAVFLACFSADGLFRDRPYQYEQFSHVTGEPVPVRFDQCEVPSWSFGNGRTLDAVPAADVFAANFDDGAASVAAAARKILGPAPDLVTPAVTAAPAREAGSFGMPGEDLAARVRNVQFRTTRMGPGYDEREVDELLDRIEAEAAGLAKDISALESARADAARGGRDVSAAAAALTWSPSVTPEDIRNKRFSTTRLRPGYDQESVDRFLEGAAAALGRLAAARADLQARLSR